MSDIRKNEHLVFREYDDRGEVLRMSVLEVDDYDKPYDYATIDVVECFE